jgi:capsid assembly protease
MKGYPHIRRALAGKLWYVHEQKMQEMLAFLEIKLAGGSSAPEVIESIRAANVAAAARSQQNAARPGAIAVIPIYGMIMHRQMADISGGSSGTSTAALSAALQQAVSDPGVTQIVLDIDSPGGDVDGVDELASEIYQARKSKKITAVSNCLCASAAYYLAAQATEIVVSPSSLTGSIGVYTMHEDDSAMFEAMGIKLELIKFGENKAEGNSLGPLTDSAREHMQEIVDTYGIAFEKAVARGRGVKQDVVHGKFGQGRVFDAKTAVKLGMADRVGTLADVLGQPSSGKSSVAARAVEEIPIPSAEEAEARKTGDGHGGACVGGCGTLLWGKTICDACSAVVAVPIRASDGDNSDCDCDCVPCDGGDCDNCSCSDCDCEGCDCASAVAKLKAKTDAKAEQELAKVRARNFDRMRHELSQAAAR